MKSCYKHNNYNNNTTIVYQKYMYKNDIDKLYNNELILK